jgi:hypothetical protein
MREVMPDVLATWQFIFSHYPDANGGAFEYLFDILIRFVAA